MNVPLLFRNATAGHLALLFARLILQENSFDFPWGDTMTERSSGQGRPDEWNQGYTVGEQYGGQQYYGGSTPSPAQPGPAQAGPGPYQAASRRQAKPADQKGFFESLFDFSFTSFVTVRIIKVLYVLIFVMVSLAALLYTILAFRLSPVAGLLVLVIGDPLYIVIVMAFWRLVLEAFVVVFRIAEDVRSMRERGDR